MKRIDLQDTAKFNKDRFFRELLYDSPNLRVLNFNFEPGQELPIHSHEADSEVSMLILEGEGELLGSQPRPIKAGQMAIMPVSEPHGLIALTRLRLLVIITPTL